MVKTPSFVSAPTSIGVPVFAPLAFTPARFSSSSFLNVTTFLLAIITRPLALSASDPTRQHKLWSDSDIIRGRPVQFYSGKTIRNGLVFLLDLCQRVVREGFVTSSTSLSVVV